VAAVWENNPDVKVGNVSLDEFTAAVDAAEALDKEYAKKDVELTGVKGNRDDKALLLGQIATRFRSGMRFIYGSVERVTVTASRLSREPNSRLLKGRANCERHRPDNGPALTICVFFLDWGVNS